MGIEVRLKMPCRYLIFPPFIARAAKYLWLTNPSNRWKRGCAVSASAPPLPRDWSRCGTCKNACRRRGKQRSRGNKVAGRGDFASQSSVVPNRPWSRTAEPVTFLGNSSTQWITTVGWKLPSKTTNISSSTAAILRSSRDQEYCLPSGWLVAFFKQENRNGK